METWVQRITLDEEIRVNAGQQAVGQVNGMATAQGFYALVAYQRLKNGQTSLYNMSDVFLLQRMP